MHKFSTRTSLNLILWVLSLFVHNQKILIKHRFGMLVLDLCHIGNVCLCSCPVSKMPPLSTERGTRSRDEYPLSRMPPVRSLNRVDLFGLQFTDKTSF